MAGGPRDWALEIGAPEHAERTATSEAQRHPILTAVSLSVGALIVLAVTFAVWPGGGLGRDDPGLPGIFIDAGSDTGDHDREALPPISEPRPVLPAPATDVAPATPDDEYRLLAQYAGSTAFSLKETHPTIKPEHLVVSGADEILSTADGQPLTRLPAGTAVHYTVSADRQSFTLTLVGSTFGTRAVYDGVADTLRRE